jgi:hypothetical protein
MRTDVSLPYNREQIEKVLATLDERQIRRTRVDPEGDLCLYLD